ncbi:MAG: hypothetical protein JWO31_1190 [Phycisphaerales bacterium]|nr:hypothetical protein [Phycisphaerales bacterium]
MADALPEVDPFTLIHRQIWAALTTFKPWTDVVRRSLRFEQADVPPGWDQAGQPCDVPTVVLRQGPFRFDPFGFDSSAFTFAMSFPLMVVGPSLNVVPVNLIKWQTVRALRAFDPAGYLKIPRLVIEPVRISGGRDHLGEPGQPAKGHERAVAVCSIDVPLAAVPGDRVASGTFEALI